MNFDWKIVELGEITEWYSGGTPPVDNPEYWDGEIPWISASSMQGNRYDSSDRMLSATGLKRGSRLAEVGMVLLLVRGSILHQRIPVGMAMMPVAFNQDVKAIKATEAIDPWFLLYWLIGHEKKLLSLVSFTGIGAGKLDTSQLHKLPVHLPPLPEQKRIASVVKAIDEKIALNCKINETLEEIAQTLFTSWFVDFDPVKAKALGRRPKGMDEATFALFPDSFEESELGMVPKGWTANSIEEIIEFNPKRNLKKGIVAPYLDMKNVPTKGHLVNVVSEREMSSGAKFKNGDTLFARITPCLENGKTAFVDFLNDDQVGWGSTEYIVMTTKDPYSVEFPYYLARHDAFRSYAIQSMTGSSGRQRADINALKSMLWVNPGEEIIRAFSKISGKIMRKIKSNGDQNKSLITLRDTLLPKLVTGEITIPEVTEQAGF